MDSQANASNPAEMVKQPLQPTGFPARPPGPPGSPRPPINNGPITGPRPGGPPHPIRRLDSRSSLGPPGQGQNPQLRPYGPPRPPGNFPPRPPGQNFPNRFQPPGFRGPGPQGPRPPNFQGQPFYGQQNFQAQQFGPRSFEGPPNSPRPPQLQRNESSLSLARQNSEENRQRPRIVVEKMEDVAEKNGELQKPENPAAKRKGDRENGEKDDDDDVVMDNEKSPRTNGNASPADEGATDLTGSPQMKKNEDSLQPPSTRPGTATIDKPKEKVEIGGKVESKEADSRPVSARCDGNMEERGNAIGKQEKESGESPADSRTPSAKSEREQESSSKSDHGETETSMMDNKEKEAPRPTSGKINDVSESKEAKESVEKADKSPAKEKIDANVINLATSQIATGLSVNAGKPPEETGKIDTSPAKDKLKQEKDSLKEDIDESSKDVKEQKSPVKETASSAEEKTEEPKSPKQETDSPAKDFKAEESDSKDKLENSTKSDISPNKKEDSKEEENAKKETDISSIDQKPETKSPSPTPPSNSTKETEDDEETKQFPIDKPDKPASCPARSPIPQKADHLAPDKDTPTKSPDKSRSSTPGMDSTEVSEKSPRDSQQDKSVDSLQTDGGSRPASSASEKPTDVSLKSPEEQSSAQEKLGSMLTPPASPHESVQGFDNGQRRSLSTRSSPCYSPQSPISPKSPGGSAKLSDGEKKKTTFAEDVDRKEEEEKTPPKTPRSPSKPVKTHRASTRKIDDGKKSKTEENGSAASETTEANVVPTTNGVADSPTKKSPSKTKDSDKRSTAGSPTKSPSKSAKSLPRTPETPSSTGQEKKKLPMNKIQVGAAPSPNLKTVRSKIGSLENASYKPGGGKVKIENRKLDFSKAQPKIAAKNEKYTPSGGDKKIAQVKLQWNAKPKVGSLENATYKPGGGDKKIETVKLDFKDKAKPKVGSKENAKHVPGGGSVKSTATPPKTPQDSSSDIQTQKIEIKAESKVGSLDNVKHKPGGGDKKIFNDKDYLRQTGSNVESLSGSGSQSPVPSGAITDVKNGLPASDENLNQEC